MIPARMECPDLWTKEYEGALMSEYRGHHCTMYECVDTDAEAVPETSANRDPTQFYHVEANCNGMPCGTNMYDAEKELMCVVCTK